MAGETERAVASGHKQAGTHAGVHAREELFTIRSVRYSLLSHDTMGRTNTQLSGTNTIRKERSTDGGAGGRAWGTLGGRATWVRACCIIAPRTMATTASLFLANQQRQSRRHKDLLARRGSKSPSCPLQIGLRAALPLAHAARAGARLHEPARRSALSASVIRAPRTNFLRFRVALCVHVFGA